MLRRLTSSAPCAGRGAAPASSPNHSRAADSRSSRTRARAAASASLTAAPARPTRSIHVVAEAGVPGAARRKRARSSPPCCACRPPPARGAQAAARGRATASTRAAAVRRRFRRPLSRAWRRTAQASEMSWSSSRVRSTHRSASSRLARLAHGVGDVAQQSAQAIVDDVDPARRRAIAQRRPDEEVDEQADDDPDQRVEQPHPDHAGVRAVAGEQDDERRRGRGRGLVAQGPRVPTPSASSSTTRGRPR